MLVELRVVDAGKVTIRIVVRNLEHVVGKNETDPQHQIKPARRQKPQTRFPIGTIAWLDKLSQNAQLAHSLIDATKRRIVERLVAPPADVEHQPDAQRSPARIFDCRRISAQRPQQKCVYPQKDQRHNEQQASRCSFHAGSYTTCGKAAREGRNCLC